MRYVLLVKYEGGTFDLDNVIKNRGQDYPNYKRNYLICVIHKMLKSLNQL
jgi:hypothetical protein